MKTLAVNKIWTGIGFMAVLALGNSLATQAQANVENGLWCQVQIGDRNEEVRTLQYLLRARGHKLTIDGVFARQTRNAVTKFQHAKGIKANGIAGEKTWQALVVRVSAKNHGDSVRALQNELKTNSYGDNLVVDGRFGTQTFKALQSLKKTRYWMNDVYGVAVTDVWANLLGGQAFAMGWDYGDEEGWLTAEMGDRAEHVRTLQYLLRARGFNLRADGVFGIQTLNAVLKVQRAHKIKADGVVDNKTWKELIVPIKLGSRGDAVKAFQNQLKVIAYSENVTVDGNYGPQTFNIAKRCQSYALNPDGTVHELIWWALLEAPHGD